MSSSSSDPTISQQPKPSSDEADTSKVEEDKQTQVVDEDANKSISQDPTISQQPESSSDDTTTSKVEEDKQTQVVDDDANKSISQHPPHFSEVTPDPKHEDTDKEEVSNEDVETPDPKHEDTDKKEVSTKDVETPNPKHEDTDKKEVSNKDVETPNPKHEDTDKKEVSNKDVETPDSKHEDADKKEVSNEDVDEEKNQTDQTKVVEAPEGKNDKQTRVADDDVNNSVSQLPQQSDDIASNTAPVEEDKQTELIDDDANKSVSPKQSDDITPNTAPVEEDKQTKLADDDANKSVLMKQADEITPDPDQGNGDNADDSADQNEQKQLGAGQLATSLASAQNATGENESGPVSDDALIVLVRRELEYIRETAKMLNDYGDICEQSLQGSGTKIEELDVSLTEAIDDTVSDDVGREKRIRDVQKEIRIFKKHLRKLKLTIPPKFKVNKDDIPELRKYLSESTQNVKLYTSDNKQILGKLDLFKEKLNHEYKSAFKDFELRYKELDYRMKLCLLCFSAIPEHEVIKKRLMVYWWIGEGFIFPENLEEKKQDLEQLGAKTFDDLLKKYFIYSADGKDSQEVDNCKMLPFVRWAVIYMAQRAKFFEFDHDGCPTEDYSSCFRACLSGNGLDTQKAPDLEKLHMMLNVNEAILELKPEWLLKMRNISILCLGRWQAASEHHIEVEDTKFLQGLKNMIHLRYLSLQGISRITELPNSVSCLTKLTMLDLRACHNLEIIPRDIGSLRMLTYLDLSECYLLTQMPRGLSKLVNLVVLKGFLVVEDPKKDKICTLEDLAKLKKLRKLSIFTGVETFPGPKDLSAFQNFKVLNKLKIVWGGKKAMKGQSGTGETKVEGDATTGILNAETSKKRSGKAVPQGSDSSKYGLPKQLQKLDLQCYPLESAPEWLKPKKLVELKKLYIRGGKLRDLNLTNDNWEVEPWNVETLRLKYLTGLGMNWTELLELFPKLIYLEKVRCTKLTLFPCNDKGVWINKAKLPKKV